MSNHTSSPQQNIQSALSTIRDLVNDWFVGNFDSGCVLRVETSMDTLYQFEIVHGKVNAYRPTTAGIGCLHPMRRAFVIQDNTKIWNAAEIGFHAPTSSFVLVDANRNYIRNTGSIRRLIHLETVSIR